MIREVSEFLLQLKEQESAKLALEPIKHAPTIGDMYEGLSKELLGRAIPSALNLQLTSGFVTDGLGSLSGQIDCMLVRGTGRSVPYTDEHVWHLKDVIAVLEIKKSLYGRNLADAFDHLQVVRNLEANHFGTFRDDKTTRMDVRAWDSARRAFGQITGHAVSHFEDVAALPLEAQAVFNVLLPESVACVRVIFGYEGFKSEADFRDSLIDRLENTIGTKGFGPGRFPHLIVSGNNSLCKASGQPFVATLPFPHVGWPFFVSSTANPLALLLEYVWTRLNRDFDLGGLWGEDLEMEALRTFLVAKPVVDDAAVKGWHYDYVPLPKGTVSQKYVPWQPEYLTEEEAVMLAKLAAGTAVRFNDPDVIEYLRAAQIDRDALQQGLVDTRLVAMQGDEIVLLTEELLVVALPTGETVAADNSTGRLTRWLQRELRAPR